MLTEALLIPNGSQTGNYKDVHLSRMDKLCYIHKGIVRNNEHELTITACDDMDEPLNVKRQQTQRSTHYMNPFTKVQTQAKLVYDVRIQDSGYPCRGGRRVSIWKRAWGA